MADEITFAGDTIWDDDASSGNGAGWTFTRGVKIRPVIEERAPQGEGYWIKGDGRNTAAHNLDLVWRTTDVSALAAMLESVQGIELGDLVIPGHGTIPNCRLSEISELTSTRSDEATGYIVQATLTFTEYP